MNFLRYFSICFLFLGSLSFSQDFLPSFGDIPLYSEVIIDSDSVLSFEVADGRIAEVRGYSSSSLSDLVDFYRLVLPSLGWDEVIISDNSLHFIRDSESFRIDFVGDGEVLFRLSPFI